MSGINETAYKFGRRVFLLGSAAIVAAGCSENQKPLNPIPTLPPTPPGDFDITPLERLKDKIVTFKDVRGQSYITEGNDLGLVPGYEDLLLTEQPITPTGNIEGSEFTLKSTRSDILEELQTLHVIAPVHTKIEDVLKKSSTSKQLVIVKGIAKKYAMETATHEDRGVQTVLLVTQVYDRNARLLAGSELENNISAKRGLWGKTIKNIISS